MNANMNIGSKVLGLLEGVDLLDRVISINQEINEDDMAIYK